MKRDAYRIFLVQTNQGEKHAWQLAIQKMNEHDWDSEDFDNEIISFKEINPNKEF
jgi:hypothetical protein